MLEQLSRHIPLLRRLDHHMKEVVEKGSAVFLLRVVGTGLNFLFNVVIARLFGAEGTGVYYLALTVTTVATVFGRMGLDNTLIRFIASGAKQNKWTQVAGVYRQGMLLATGVSVAISVVVFITAPWLARVVFAEPDLTLLLRIMSLGITPLSLLSLHAQSLKAVTRPVLATMADLTGVSLLSVLLIFPFSQRLGIAGIAVAYVVARASLLLVGWLCWRRATPNLRGIRGTFSFHQLLATSWPLLWVASMSLVMQWTDTFMLGLWATADDVGVYGVAMRTAGLTSFVLVAVNSIVAPKFAVMYEQNDLEGLGALARNAARLMACLSLPFLVVFAIFPTWILRIFGTDFTQGSVALTILAVGQFVNVATGSVGYLLMMTGREKLMQYNLIGSALTNILLNAALIPSFGVIGAAVATAVTLAGMNIISAVLVHRELKVTTLPIPGRRFFSEAP